MTWYGGRTCAHSTFSASANALEGGQTQGLAIVSRYPLSDVRVRPLTYNQLRFKSRCRIALEATVITSSGPVRVVNVHLDTRINSGRRVAQLTPVLDALDGFDYPRIVGGDFNTMNIGWCQTMWPLPYVQRQAAAVRNVLATSGFQTPFENSAPTFKVLGMPLKLDWLFLKQLDPIVWNVDAVPLTDHRGVWAQVRTRPATGTSCS